MNLCCLTNLKRRELSQLKVIKCYYTNRRSESENDIFAFESIKMHDSQSKLLQQCLNISVSTANKSRQIHVNQISVCYNQSPAWHVHLIPRTLVNQLKCLLLLLLHYVLYESSQHTVSDFLAACRSQTKKWQYIHSMPSEFKVFSKRIINAFLLIYYVLCIYGFVNMFKCNIKQNYDIY